MKLTNFLMAEKLNIPISKIRRWTKEFLPPDPKATRRSGYARKFSANNGFFVFLGGRLVSEYGFSFVDARKILKDLKPWMKEVGLFPKETALFTPKGVDTRLGEYRVKIWWHKGQFRYEAEGALDKKSSIATEPTGRMVQIMEETRASYSIFSDLPDRLVFFARCLSIPITAFLDDFKQVAS